jgi:molybdenum cofactor biosynthesis enzyme
MCKAVDHGMSFSDVWLLSKSGGKSGPYNREGGSEHTHRGK